MTVIDNKALAQAITGAVGKNDEESTVSTYLDTGYPELNYALSSRWNGGFPVGRIVELAGPPSAGKTALATRAMAAAQKQGGIAGFMDHERSFSLRLAPNLGLDPTDGLFTFKKPRTFEESVSIFASVAETVRSKKLIPASAPICWVFDSLASMVPKSALFDKNGKERSAEDRNMNDNTALARATSAHFPALAMLAEEYGACLIFLNQIRMKLGVLYGDPRTTPGGDAPKFYASTRIFLSSAQIKSGKEIIGAEVTANVIKNKVARPFLKASWRFMFNPDGTGKFDFERSMVDFMEREGFLPKASRNGFVMWNGVQIGKEQLARDIEARGAFGELLAMLPAEYEPEVVAEIEAAE